MRVLKRLGFVMTALVMILIVLMYKGDLPASEVDAKYANKHSRFLDVASGARIHYRDEGNPLGLPLVLCMAQMLRYTHGSLGFSD